MIGYKIENTSELTREFVLNNAKVFAPPGQEIGRLPLIVSGVWIHIVEMDGRLKVMLEFGEDTVHDDIRDATIYAREWRERILEWQGPWAGGGDTAFLESLHRRQERGESYQDLATLANHQLRLYLNEFSAFRATLEETRSRGDEMNFLEAIYRGVGHEDTPSPFSYEFAYDLLASLRFKEDEIDPILMAGLDRIRGGSPPFEEGEPVHRKKMISVIRTWRQGPKHRLLVESSKENDPTTEDGQV